ncbi:hypothetical protein N0V82_009700 [Gnomoniopsis sp. IMI 355080]|nr:hypothetical protein N0V82_009700 [Gnomoniopsis sp. IMI 355080]
MADDHEDNGHRARPGDKVSRRVNVHRVNDCVLGHVGQISYRPVTDDDVAVGDLRFNRLDENREFKTTGVLEHIEFATKIKQHDTIRWLIAQKNTSTTIFEPELRAKPITWTASTSGRDDEIAEHIVINPIATLTTNVTGGEPHCDFSINFASNDLAPQLAIIDRSGNWSVWYIGRIGHGRSKAAKAVLMRKGSCAWSAPVSSIVDDQSITYRIVWTSRSDRADEWERESSPSTRSEPPDGDLPAALLADPDASRPKYDGLLMCDHTLLQVLDVEGERTPSRLDFTRRDGMDNVLDARCVYGSPSHVLVLTTDKLYLLDVSHVEGQNFMSPHILTSCSHFRSDPRETLKLSITKLRTAYGEAGTLVTIHSAQSSRVDLFWFIINLQHGTVQSHHQVVHFSMTSTANVGEAPGIESLAALPLHIAALKGKHRQASEGDTVPSSHAAGAQLFQLFALTSDLSLSSSIVALTQDVRQKLATPTKFDDLSWTDERRARFFRRKWLREIEQAFVIPDKAEPVKSSSVVRVPTQVDKYDRIQLRYYMLKLVQEINKAYTGGAVEGSIILSGTEYFTTIQAAMKSWQGDEHMPLKPLLSFSNLWQPFELSQMDEERDFNIQRLVKSQHAHIFECGTYGSKQSVMDLFEKMSINWSATVPADSLKASQWRYMELALERMAAEVHMSERGVYMAPQSTLDLASKSGIKDETQVDVENDLNENPSSQPLSSQMLPTPSATPSSSRAASEAVDSTMNSQEDDASGLEDPAVARLRMYLPSIKFTPPPKSGPSRVISLWPEQRNIDPSQYQYRPPGQGPDEKAEAKRQRQERKEHRQRRREEKMAQLGIKMERAGESYSQPYQPTMIRSSPPLQDIGSSQRQAPTQSQSQSQSFSQGFGASQSMSQPLPGMFGGRPRLRKGKVKVKKERRPGF